MRPLTEMQIYRNGGFVGFEGLPTRDRPQDWYVWHFTRLQYLAEVLTDGCLRCDDSVPPREGSVADPAIKDVRRRQIVRADGYPDGRSVSSHVPWYFAAKSPMLYRVVNSHPMDVVDSLVFLGVRINDVIDAELEWVASNVNAASGISRFSADIATLGTFIDFDLMAARDWYNTPDDPARKLRRSAEFLVHGSVPLHAVSVVAAKNAETLASAQLMFSSGSHNHIEYRNARNFLSY